MTLPTYVSQVVNPYNRRDSANRKGVMVGGPWTSEIERFVNCHDIRAVYLNRHWPGSDYAFLARLTGVEELHIQSGRRATNLASIELMSQLVDLNLTCVATEQVDFSQLTQLRECYLYWWPGAESIVRAPNLETLYLDNFRPAGAVGLDLSRLQSLRRLTLANSSVRNVCFLADAPDLVELELLNCRKLADFASIAELARLERLAIDGSRDLEALDFLSNLSRLEVLRLSNNKAIQSLKPVADCQSLKAVAFGGDTVVTDGDLYPLLELPRLGMLTFRPRKHYSHKLIKEWNWENLDVPATLLSPTR